MPERPSQHALARAVPLYILAGLFLSSLDATAKILVRDYPVWWVVWARYAGHMLIVIPLAWHKVGRGFWRTEHAMLQVARSALLVVATTAFFSALIYLPLAEASAISFLAPIIVVLMSGRMLGEVVTPVRWIAAGAGFVGVLLITRPGSAAFHPATLLMLGMAACNALYQMLTRKLQRDSAYTTLFHSATVGVVAFTLLLPMLAPHPLPGLRDAFLFLLCGVLAGLGHWCMITAFLQAQASQLTPFTYLQMVWPLGFGWMIFGQFPDAISFAGMAVILASGTWLAWQERRRPQPVIAPPAD